MNKNLKKRIINKIADETLRGIIYIYKTVLYIYICEMLAFAFFVICEHEGVISPEPYKNMFEAFFYNGLQMSILTIAIIFKGIYIAVKHITNNSLENSLEYIIEVICIYILGIVICLNKINFMTIQSIKAFVEYSVLILGMVLILYGIRGITFVQDSQFYGEPLYVAARRMDKNKNKGENN